MRKKLSKRRQARRKKARLGYGIMATIVILIAGLGAIYLQTEKQKNAFDPNTLCPNDRLLSAHTILLVDKTEALTGRQQTAVRYLVRDVLKKQLKDFERLSIILITEPAPLFIVPVFSLCNPGTGENTSELTGNRRMVERTYERKFGQPLDNVLKDLLVGKPARRSPILETISRIGSLKEFSASVKDRKLIVFSDMLQNVPDYSHYVGSVDFENFKTLPYANSVKADLMGVEVVVYYLERAHAVRTQNRDHVDFWMAYFDDSGVANVTFSAPPTPPVSSVGKEAHSTQTEGALATEQEKPRKRPVPQVQPGAPALHNNVLSDIREFLAANPSPEEGFARAEALRATGTIDLAFLLYRDAAERGHAGSANMIGSMYDPETHTSETSPLPEPNPDVAAKWYRLAAEAGIPAAQRQLGKLLYHGWVGATANEAAGVEWLRKAAEQGDNEAKQILTELGK